MGAEFVVSGAEAEAALRPQSSIIGSGVGDAVRKPRLLERPIHFGIERTRSARGNDEVDVAKAVPGIDLTADRGALGLVEELARVGQELNRFDIAEAPGVIAEAAHDVNGLADVTLTVCELENVDAASRSARREVCSQGALRGRRPAGESQGSCFHGVIFVAMLGLRVLSGQDS